MDTRDAYALRIECTAQYDSNRVRDNVEYGEQRRRFIPGCTINWN